MNDKEQVVKHLEMIQGVINRLGHDSFLIKGWSVTLVVAGVVVITRNEVQPEWIAWVLLILVVVFFWTLDGYFLWQERLFRKVYDEIRKQETTEFEMNPGKHAGKPECTWLSAVFSVTLFVFYAPICIVLSFYSCFVFF